MGSRIRNPWLVVLGALLGLFVGNGPIMQFTIGVFIKPIGKDMGWDRATISTGMVVGLVMTGLCTPFVGRLIDRRGVRAVTIPAIVLFSLLIASVSLVPASPIAFILLYACMGIAAAGQTPLPYARAISLNFDKQRGLCLGIAMAGVGLGAALVPQFARLLIEAYGWRTAYVGLGAMTLLIGLPAIVFLIHEPVKTAEANSTMPPLPGANAATCIRMPIFWKLAVAFFLVAVAANGTVAHIVPLVTDRGLSTQQATVALSTAGLALIAGRLLAGFLLDRLWAPYVAATFFLLPCIGIMIVAFSATPALAVTGTVLIGLGLGAEVDLIAFFISRYLGLRAFGEIYGYLFAVFMFGSALGPLLMGLGFDRFGAYHGVLYLFAFILLVAIGLIVTLGPYNFPAARRDKGTTALRPATI